MCTPERARRVHQADASGQKSLGFAEWFGRRQRKPALDNYQNTAFPPASKLGWLSRVETSLKILLRCPGFSPRGLVLSAVEGNLLLRIFPSLLGMVKHRRYVTLMLLYIELKFLLIFSQAIHHFHRLLQFCRVKLFPGFLCGCLSCGHSILPLFAMRFLVVQREQQTGPKVETDSSYPYLCSPCLSSDGSQAKRL